MDVDDFAWLPVGGGGRSSRSFGIVPLLETTSPSPGAPASCAHGRRSGVLFAMLRGAPRGTSVDKGLRKSFI
jgi:hypothetical protein